MRTEAPCLMYSQEARFCLDQHHETVLKNDFLMLPRFLQVLPAFSHAGQVKTFEVLEDLIFHVC